MARQARKTVFIPKHKFLKLQERKRREKHNSPIKTRRKKLIFCQFSQKLRVVQVILVFIILLSLPSELTCKKGDQSRAWSPSLHHHLFSPPSAAERANKKDLSEEIMEIDHGNKKYLPMHKHPIREIGNVQRWHPSY